MHIVRTETVALAPDTRRDILALCELAYEEDLSPYVEWIGPGVHLCGYDNGVLVSHLMIVERALQAGELPTLRTAYVELVATHPAHQGRRYASTLLRAAEPDCDRFELAALSPSAVDFYMRLGWELWRGTLFVRTDSGLQPTPDEEVMVRRTPQTPPGLSLDLPLSVEWREGEVW